LYLDPVVLYGVYALVMSILTIGQLAKAGGVGVETIRFYEREGLIEEPPRRRSGYRQYPLSAVRRVLFIRRAKELGFTLSEIQGLLSLRVASDRTCAEVRDLTRAKLLDIERRIAELQRMGAALSRVARACRGKGPTSECPLLDALDEGGDIDA
jgi:MerR family transcriptional regulator, copper efflux regulator